MPLPGGVRKKESTPDPNPDPKVPGTTGSSTTGKKGVDKTVPIHKKAPKNDDETLDDSAPVSPQTLADAFQGMKIGGLSLSTILLIVLFAGMGYLMIKVRGK